MRTFTATYCLEKIGVQRWYPTQVLPGAKQTLDFDAYGLYNSFAEANGLLCIERRVLGLAQERAVSRLIDAMLSAVQLVRAPLLEESVPTKDSLIIVMGERLAQKALACEQPLDSLRADNLRVGVGINQARVLVTYHPLDLIVDPANKAKTWQDLKKILPLIQ